MANINYENLPSTRTPLNATNLNSMQVEDSGSNARGYWIKYNDGTLIQWNKLEVQDQAITDSYGSLYQGKRTITFPIAFVGTVPAVTCSDFTWGTGASWGAVIGNATPLTVAQLRGYDIASRASGTRTFISWLAIGKWK